MNERDETEPTEEVAATRPRSRASPRAGSCAAVTTGSSPASAAASAAISTSTR